MEGVLVKSKGGWKRAAKLERAGFDLAGLASNGTSIWTEAFRRAATL